MIDIVCFCKLSCFFFFKQKTAYEMRISDWSSDVCSSDLLVRFVPEKHADAGPFFLGVGPGAVVVADLSLGQIFRREADAEVVVEVTAVRGDRKSTRLNSSHSCAARMPSSS